MKGSRPQVDAPNNKPAVIALREIAEGRCRLPVGWEVLDVDRAPESDLPPDQR
jgi:DNA-directed RNA polymerase subunit K/omega